MRLRLLVLAGCATAAIGAFPAAATAAAPSCAGLPAHGAIPVVDTANVVPAEAEAYLAADLLRFHVEGNEAIVVATVPNLGGDDVSAYARRLFDCWGVGDADSDNGVLILVAMRERRARIEVGAGLEEELGEAELSAALNALAGPMRAGNVAGGLRAAAVSVAADLGSALPDTATLVRSGVPGASPGVTTPGDVPDGAVPSFGLPDGFPTDSYSPFAGSPGGAGSGLAKAIPVFVVIALVGTLVRAVFRGGLGGGSGGESTWRGGFPGGDGFGGRWGSPTVLHGGGWSGWGSSGGSGDSGASGSSGSSGGSFGGSSGGSPGGSSSGSSGSFGGGSSGGGGASGSW